jgi:hypothetical protein
MPRAARETAWLMAEPGSRRQDLSTALTSAYGAGLLSDATLAHRMDLLLDSLLIEPERVVGDLTTRNPARLRGPLPTRVRAAATELARRAWDRPRSAPWVLALDWSGHTEELTLGRDPGCDIVLGGETVSRRHAVLSFRDGQWILKDLGSRNGTAVNRRRVVRCRLQAGDRLDLGDETLVVD